MSRVQEAAEKALSVCKHNNWERGWSRAGCYLHLEVSEFIEALRGKGDTTLLEEAADDIIAGQEPRFPNGVRAPSPPQS